MAGSGSNTVTATRSPFSWKRSESELRRLVATGKTASQLAAALGTTRNAVIGKAHRLGLRIGVRANLLPVLKAIPVPPVAEPVKASLAPRVIAPAFQSPICPVPSTPEPVSLLDAREGQCRFSIDLPARPSADMLVCGAAVMPGRSWCPTCATRVFDRASRPVPRFWRPSR